MGGATERAPLATTHGQYREWKRAIRADAACRIQALFRGASTRWMLLRSNNPKISKVVRTRAGRCGFAFSNDIAPTSIGGQSSVLAELSIPAEIGDNRQENVLSANARGAPSLDVHIQGSNQTLVPQWGDQIHRRRSGSSDFNSNNAPIPRPASPVISANPRTSIDLNNLSLPELQACKRELKQQLKQYDMSFARRNLPSSTSSPTGAQAQAPTQDLTTLKAEKGRLHQMLRSFERDFFRENQRQVQSFADIRPVASQYRRYKEIKRAIAALQRGDALRVCLLLILLFLHCRVD